MILEFAVFEEVKSWILELCFDLTPAMKRCIVSKKSQVNTRHVNTYSSVPERRTERSLGTQ